MEAVTRRGPSRWKRLSVPTARLNTLRGLTRSGLWSSFSWLGKGPYPPCGSAKRRQKIVKRHDIRQIRDFHGGSNASRPFPVEEIVGADNLFHRSEEHPSE